MVVGAEHVDEPVEPARELAADVRGVGREVGRRAVRADDHAILVVAVRGRPRPEGALRLVGVDRLERLGDLRLDDALALERVEVDAEALEGRLDLLEHPRHGVARLPREVGDVVALVAVLGRLLAAPDRLDGRAEPVHLRPGVVVVVLALDPVPGELEQPRDRVAVGAVPRRRDGDRARRVRGDELDLDALGRLR